jgi:hypothetical protein
VLALAAAAPALLATGGCGALLPGERRPPRPLTAGELTVDRTAAEAARLRDAAARLAKQKGLPAELLDRIAADHEAHLAALGALPVAGEVTAPPSADPSPVEPDARGQRDAEWAGARAALRDALTAEAGLAALLVRIATSRALHADAVAAGRAPAPPDRLDPAAALRGSPATATASPSGSATSAGTATETATDGAAAALGRLLAGEYAAVFAYPAIVARCAPARRARAQELWQAHVAARDELERVLGAGERGGVDPPAPAPAYDIGDPPATPDAAAALAATVEGRLTALAVAAVAATADEDRLLAARHAVASARRAVFWGAAAAPLPGAGGT